MPKHTSPSQQNVVDIEDDSAPVTTVDELNYKCKQSFNRLAILQDGSRPMKKIVEQVNIINIYWSLICLILWFQSHWSVSSFVYKCTIMPQALSCLQTLIFQMHKSRYFQIPSSLHFHSVQVSDFFKSQQTEDDEWDSFKEGSLQFVKENLVSEPRKMRAEVRLCLYLSNNT